MIDDDGLSLFDPTNDGIDFYEAVEGLLVEIASPLAVSPFNKYKEVFDQLEESFYIECKTNLRHQMHIADLKDQIKSLEIELKIKKQGL